MDQVSLNSNHVTSGSYGFDDEAPETGNSGPPDGDIAPRNPNADHVTRRDDDRESDTGQGQRADGDDGAEYDAQINFVATAGGNGFAYPIAVELVKKGSSELDRSIAENEPEGGGSSALDQAIVANEPEGHGASALDRAIVENEPERHAVTDGQAVDGYVWRRGRHQYPSDVLGDGGTVDGAAQKPWQSSAWSGQQTFTGRSDDRATVPGSGTNQSGDDAVEGRTEVDADGHRKLDPGRFPPAPHDPSLVEKGRIHVNSLKSGGDLPPGRAAEILADGVFLQIIGTLLGDGGARDLRAVAVLITDTGGAGGPADRYLSNLALDGAISLEEFHDLANDTDFIGAKLVPHFPDAEAAEPTSPEANMEVLLRLGGVAQPDGTVYAVGEDGLLIAQGEEPEARGSSFSSSSSTTVDQPQEPAEDAITTAHNVTTGGQPFPEELQQRLNAARADGGRPDPLLARAAEVFGGTVPVTPVEQFLARSYLRGLIPLDDYIARVNDPAFLDDHASAVAAETLLGTAPDHGPADDFMNTIYSQGHIDLDTYVAEVNDEVKMADLAAAAELGVVNYTSAGFGDLDALIDGLDLSEEGLKAILHPGVNLDDGPPSPEQIAAFHHLAGGRDRNFVELVTTWLLHHNPGYSIRFGYPTPEAKEAGEPKSFFWTDNGQQVEDPFLDSLLTGLHPGKGDRLDAATGHGVVGGGHGEDDGSDSDMIEVRIAYEGVTGEGKDELTDTSRHLDRIIYPDGELEERLATIGGVPIDLDDNFDGEYVSGSGARARQAFEAIDPALTDGVQISWVKGADGVDLRNPSRLEKTVLYIEESNGITFQGNDGPVDTYVYGSDFRFETGSGNAPIIQMERPIVADTAHPDALHLGPDSDIAFLDGRITDHLNNPATLQLVRSFSAGPDPLAAVLASEESPFTGLAPEEKAYVYSELVEAFRAEADPQTGGQTGGQTGAQGGAGPSDEANPASARDRQSTAGYRQWIDGHAAGLLQMTGGNLLGERPGPSVVGLLRQETLPDGTSLSDADRQAIYDSAESILVAGSGQFPVPGSGSASPLEGADPLASYGGSAASGSLADPPAVRGGAGVPDRRHAEVDNYVAALVEEVIGAANIGQLSVEAVPTIVHAMLDESAAPGTIELSPDELAHAHARADTLLFGPDALSYPRQPSATTSDVRDPLVTAAGDVAIGTPSGGYVPYIRPVERPSAAKDVAWDALADEALTRYTRTVDGAPRFDDEAFFGALYDDPALLERLGSDALDYIGARAVELAIRAGIEPVGDALA